MKKKIDFKKIVAGTLATTILVESCTKSYYEPLPVSDINQQYNNSNFRNISIPFTKEEKEYLKFVNYLLGDIIRNPQVAEIFITDPNAYAMAVGFNNIKLDQNDALLQSIVVIADPEIRDAVINNDISRFLQLCKAKSIIKDFDIETSPIIKGIIEKNPNIKTDINLNIKTDDIKTMTKAAATTVTSSDRTQSAARDQDGISMIDEQSFVAFAVAVVAGVAVFIWAVAVTHVAVGNVAVAATAVETVAAISHVTVSTGTATLQRGFLTPTSPQDEFLLQLWKINGGNPEKTYVLMAEHKENHIQSVIDALKQTFPEKFTNINEDDLKQFLALNA